MKKSHIVLIVILLDVIIAAVLLMLFFPRPSPYQGLDADQVLALIAEANGSLEDQDQIIDVEHKVTGFANAERLYQQLREQLPSEVLPLRNLAVLRAAQALTNRKLSADQKRVYLTETEALLGELSRVEGQAAAAEYLRSHILFKFAGDVATQPALDAINRALELQPDTPMFWGWKVYLLETIRDDEPQREAWLQQRHEAIERAWTLDDTNVYLLAQSLVDLAQRQDPAVLDRVKEGKQLIEVMRYPVLKSNPRSDPYVYLDRLEADVTRGDWDAALTSASFAFNLLRSSLGIYNLDSNRAIGHPLDLMVHRPSEAFFENTELRPYRAPSASIRWDTPSLIPGLSEPALDVSVADVDLDQRQDLIVLTAERLVVLLATGDGTLKAAHELTFESPGSYQRLFACDLDQDDLAKAHGSEGASEMGEPEEAPEYFLADPDFVLWGSGGLAIVLNLDELGRDRHLALTPLPTEVQEVGAIASVAIFDLDFDADLDLVVGAEQGAQLLLNRGSGDFLVGTELVRFPDSAFPLTSMSVVDWDRDLDLDVITANGAELGILENLLQGRLRYRPLSELNFSGPVATALALEADGVPSWDLAVSPSAEEAAVITTQTQLAKVSQDQLLAVDFGWTSQARFEDLDNDGVQDSIDLQDGKVRVAQGATNGGFGSPIEPVDVASCAGFEVVDWDGDGLLDLVVAGADGVSWVKNTTDTDSSWLSLQLIGDAQQTGRIPRDALGSIVEINNPGRYQAKVVRSQQTHFGLGDQQQLPAARMLWSNGMPQAIVAPRRNSTVFAPIYLKGSCPFLYTWDGEKFVFVTDCLWAAPLGLLQNRNELMPAREWEYLKVPGELLRRNDEGKYVIQLTEELWEAAYFDEVRLIAVDHPSRVDIYSNEKVGPPSIAQYKIHTVGNHRRPVSATGTQGQDVMPLVAQADDEYYRGFDRRIVQGLVTEHWLQLDLGDLSNAEQVTLFLTGWIHPTDTSLNVSFTDHPDRNAPRPPEIWVVDESGEWQRWDAPIGFPGGKTKTIAVDLSPLCPRPDGRVRIVTTAEIYWDEAFFTVDEPKVEIREFPLVVETADLHYRGFSARLPKEPNRPERFDYQHVTQDPLWAPMQGRFTRYGDVSELLHATDDQMVVMGSGDELTVTFELLAEDPPAGWKRDFLLHCVGWDKDADLNTILGQDTEPLPYAGMGLYPYSQLEKDWSRGELADYFSRYQTRRSSWNHFWKSSYWSQSSELPAAASVQ